MRYFKVSLTLTLSQRERESFRVPIQTRPTNQALKRLCKKVNSYNSS